MAIRSIRQSHANSKTQPVDGSIHGQNPAPRRQARRGGWPFTCLLGTIFCGLVLFANPVSAAWVEQTTGVFVNDQPDGYRYSFNFGGMNNSWNFSGGNLPYAGEQAAVDAAYGLDQTGWDTVVWPFISSQGLGFLNPAAPAGPAAAIGEIVTDGLSLWDTVKVITCVVLAFLICGFIVSLIRKISKL